MYVIYFTYTYCHLYFHHWNYTWFVWIYQQKKLVCKGFFKSMFWTQLVIAFNERWTPRFLAREDKDCCVIDGMGYPMSRQRPIPTRSSLAKLSSQDVGAPVPPLKRLRKEKGYMPTLELEMLANTSHSYCVNFDEYSHTRKNITQSVPNLVWRKVYGGFRKEFPNIRSEAETLIKGEIERCIELH